MLSPATDSPASARARAMIITSTSAIPEIDPADPVEFAAHSLGYGGETVVSRAPYSDRRAVEVRP